MKYKIGEYIIVNNQYDNTIPFKIKVTEVTNYTILFDNLDCGRKI